MGIQEPSEVLSALASRNRVEGLTHKFYRYPARFNPEFVRAAIREWTLPGDTVLDPFMGGGTTIVEALAEGRIVAGVDINPVACLVARVKTTPLSAADQAAIMEWSRSTRFLTNPAVMESTDSRLSNAPAELLAGLAPMVTTASGLRFIRRSQFARCAILQLAQWALESRTTPCDPSTLACRLVASVEAMLKGVDELVAAAARNGNTKRAITRRRTVYQGDVTAACSDAVFVQRCVKPRLVLTSPPYPGVHVLYHRLQVRGRRETAVPFWIAGLEDGHGPSYYTLGGRSGTGVERYYLKLSRAFGAVRQIVHPEGVVVQLVGFSDRETQLPRYLEAMEAAGFVQERSQGWWPADGVVRTVPNRRWYTQARDARYQSEEILLVHRPLG